MAYNQSRIKLFRRCQKAYAFRYDTKPGKEMVPRVPKRGLSLGSWLHDLQQVHHQEWAEQSGFDAAVVWGEAETEDGEAYVDRRTVEEVHAAHTEEYENYFEEERTELGDLPTDAHRLFRAYLRHWQKDSDRYRVAPLHDGSPSIEFVVEVPLEKWGINTPFKGRIDLLIEDLEYGGLWVWDHKWMKKIPGPDERMMSPQRVLYVWALRKLGYDIRGFIFNYGRTKPPTVPTPLKRSSKYGAAGFLSMRPSMDTDYYTYLEAIKINHGDKWKEAAKHVYMPKLKELHHRQHTDWFRRERIPVEPGAIRQGLAEFIVTIQDIERRNKNFPPRSYFYNCPFSCEYHDICVASYQGLDISKLIKKQFTFQKERYKGGEPTTEEVI